MLLGMKNNWIKQKHLQVEKKNQSKSGKEREKILILSFTQQFQFDFFRFSPSFIDLRTSRASTSSGAKQSSFILWNVCSRYRKPRKRIVKEREKKIINCIFCAVASNSTIKIYENFPSRPGCLNRKEFYIAFERFRWQNK